MFDIKELKINEGASVFTGSSALQVLQNAHTFILDLLVRESIQNSSDAAIKGASVFQVFYNSGTFVNEELAPYFDKETETRLISRYPSTCSYLEIRDRNTVGLTGETILSKRDNTTKSNFLRLIFDMGKGQDQMNAGGNWGYGKTVYYRLGNGIVIYYSRIQTDDGEFKSRLMLTLVEDEEETNALLRKKENNSAGRAWWGERIGNDICPIEDESIISDFLAVFGIEPFDSEETGTAIIIPYIDETAIMEAAKTGFKVDEAMLNRCSFLTSISSYLKYAIQKWYAPVINNFELRKLGRKFLNAYVDSDQPIQRDEIYPIFKLVQELYTSAYAQLVGKNYQPKYPIVCKASEGNYKRRPLKFGVIAFSKIKLVDLQGEELLLPPNVYMNLSDEEYNSVISLYMRDLGMILNYEETWVNIKELAMNPDELLVTLFVPDTGAVLTFGDESINLGEYLRKREEADHMKWDDDPAKIKLKCVKQIKNSVDVVVRKHYNPDQFEVHSESDMSEFAGVLGEKLFPLKKSKPKTGGGGGGAGGGVSRSEKKFNFFTKGTSITSQGRIKVLYELELKEKASVVIKTKIHSDVAVDAEKWVGSIGTSYPLRILNFVIDSQDMDTAVESVEMNCELIVSGERNKVAGSFEIEASDKKLAFVIDCEEKKEEDN